MPVTRSYKRKILSQISSNLPVKQVKSENLTEKFEKIQKLDPRNQEKLLNLASEILLNQGVIALKTDTLYGIACVATNDPAVKKLYEIKNRDRSKAISICVGFCEQIFRKNYIFDQEKLGKLPKIQNLIAKNLPGPYTFILEEAKTNQISNLLNQPDAKTGSKFLGVRIPDDEFILKLCQKVGQPLALTSANLSGEKSPLKISDFSKIHKKLDLIIDGGVIEQQRFGSTIVKITEQEVELIRQGIGYNWMYDQVMEICDETCLDQEKLMAKKFVEKFQTAPSY